MKLGSTMAVVAAMAIASTASAQQPTGTVKVQVPLGTPSVFERLGLKEGLPQLDVFAIEQDLQGFLWFGTQEGLARYDGTEMRVFRAGEGEGSLSDSYVVSLEVDASGALWVGTLHGGLCRLDPIAQGFSCMRGRSGGLSSDGITSLFADGDAMWVGTDDGHLARVARATRAVQGEEVARLPAPGAGAARATLAVQDQEIADVPTAVTAVARGPDGAIWVGLEEQGLRRLDPASGQVERFRHSAEADSLAGNTVTALRLERGALWIGTDAGLDRMVQPGKFEHVRLDPDRERGPPDHVKAFFLDPDGSLWVATRRGVVLKEPDGALTRFVGGGDDPNGLPVWEVISAFRDRGGVRWFGTDGTGLNKLTDTRRAFGYQRTSEASSTMGFHELPDGTLWSGSNPGALMRYDLQRRITTVYRKVALAGGGVLDLGTTWVTTIQDDGGGVLWAGTNGAGIFSFDLRSETAQQISASVGGDGDALGSDTIWRSIQERSGMLAFATWGGGVVRIDPRTRALTVHDEEGGLLSDYVYDVAEDLRSPGVLWVGTAAGLCRLDTASKKVQSWSHDPANRKSLSHDSVTSVHQAPDGILWIGTYGGGLNRFDEKTGEFEVMTGANDESHETFLGVLGDAQGNLWASTNGRGLVKFDPRTRKFRHFDSREGVPLEYAQFAYYRGPRSGLLYFGAPMGGPGGMIRFDPARIRPDSFAPPVVLTSFKIFDKDVRLGRPVWSTPALDLSYRDSVLSIQYSAMSFSSTGRTRFAYMLEGLHDEWIETDRPFVTYANLQGGDYVFRVRAANADGAWSATPTALTLHVSPPPWKTWWAYTLYGAALVALLVGGWRSHRRKLSAAERDGRLAVAEQGIALTGAVQAGFLPRVDHVEGPSLHVAALYRPAQACSGDWWWHEQIGSMHCIVVADVTGHGPGPAMVTAAVATAFRVQADLGTDDFVKRIAALDREVIRVGEGRYLMTLSLVLVDEVTGRYRVCSAGGLPVIRVHADGTVKAIACRGTPLGVKGFLLDEKSGTLDAGDRLVALTDGIPEMQIGQGRMLGLRRFIQFLTTTRTLTAREAVSQILVKAEQHRAGSQEDDWTLAVVDWPGGASPSGRPPTPAR